MYTPVEGMRRGAMERIAWIEAVPEEEATGSLAASFERERNPVTKRVDHILRVHSLHPETLDDHARMYHTLMHGESGLSRAEREMIAVVVSAINDCRY